MYILYYVPEKYWNEGVGNKIIDVVVNLFGYYVASQLVNKTLGNKRLFFIGVILWEFIAYDIETLTITISNVNEVVLCHDSFYLVRNIVFRNRIIGFSPGGGIMHVLHILFHFTGRVA